MTIFSDRLVPLSCLVAALLAVAVAIGGCESSQPGVIVEGDQLTVVTSAPLSGDFKAAGEAMVNGERLALADANGRAGSFDVSLTVLNSVQGRMKISSDARVASNARSAVLSPTSIAYIGDYDSAATAVSLPLINQAGIAQISPLSAYPGFTGSEQAGPDEPRRFYPSGKRTFLRLAPSQVRETEAQASLQAQQGCKESFVIYDDSPAGKRSASAAAAALKAESVAMAGSSAASTAELGISRLVAAVKSSKADCVAYGASINLAAAELLNQLSANNPALKFFVGRSGDNAPFTENLSARAQRATLITGPGPDPQRLSTEGSEVSKRYRRQFGSAPGIAGLYGYAAMTDVLEAIRRSGAEGNNRARVLSALSQTEADDSAVGRYSITPDGDSTLTTIVVSRVVGGQLVISPFLTDAINE